jgi:hypothetical protein
VYERASVVNLVKNPQARGFWMHYFATSTVEISYSYPSLLFVCCIGSACCVNHVYMRMGVTCMCAHLTDQPPLSSHFFSRARERGKGRTCVVLDGSFGLCRVQGQVHWSTFWLALKKHVEQTFSSSSSSSSSASAALPSSGSSREHQGDEEGILRQLLTDGMHMHAICSVMCVNEHVQLRVRTLPHLSTEVIPS